MKSVLLNNQLLKLANYNECQEIISNESFESVKINNRLIKRLQKVELPLLKNYSELILGIIVIGVNPLVMFYLLLDLNGVFQRITIQSIECKQCNWKGVVGNHLESENYIGIFDEIIRKEALDEAKQIERMPCPNCRSHFDRPAIWVGELPRLPAGESL